MKPSQVSQELRRIAAALDNSKKPRSDLVAKDIRKILGSLEPKTGPYGVKIEKFNLDEYVDPSDKSAYPYGVIEGEFVFRLPNGTIIHIKGRSDAQNQGFDIKANGHTFDINPDSAPDGMIYLTKFDPDFEPDDLTIDDLIHNVAKHWKESESEESEESESEES
jgi:hypothetical protein